MPWNPSQYQRFRHERRQPAVDLIAMTRAEHRMRVADLGCGPGDVTLLLHEKLHARETVGFDSSAAMLERARTLEAPGLRFAAADIADLPEEHGSFDLIFSNAALHWIPDHPALLRRLASRLAPGGQLAVQVPANVHRPSHTVADEVAAEEPFASALGGYRHPRHVLEPEAYAELLHELGFAAQRVEMRIYGHTLAHSADVVEWVKGSLLTDYEAKLEPVLYEKFVARYRARLLERIGESAPYFFTYRRLLLWAARASAER